MAINRHATMAFTSGARTTVLMTRMAAPFAARLMLFEVRDPAQVRARLPAVHDAVYLLFNEGYHGAHPQQAVREDLCHEAIRLGVTKRGSPGSWTRLRGSRTSRADVAEGSAPAHSG